MQSLGRERRAGPPDAGEVRRVLPFALTTLLSLLAVSMFAPHTNPTDLVLAGGLTVAIVVCWLRPSWLRLSWVWRSAPAYAVFGLVALMRDAVGGGQSGLGVLVLLPVTWLALYGTRRQLLASLACTVAVFALPLLVIGPPTYTAVDWRKAVVVTAMAALVALVVSRNVAELEAGRRRAEQLAAALAVTEANLAAVSAAGRELRTRHDVRPAIAESVAAIAAAEMVMLLEPDGQGSVAQTAALGFTIPPVHIPLNTERSGAVRAMVSGRSCFAADAQSDPRVSTAIARATGVRSALFEPLLRDGRAVGVLLVGWTSAVGADDPRVAAARAYALEATVALERADDLQVLRRAAAEDPLTGAANRRSLDLILATELPVHGETERAVLMVDLDHFKAYNDAHGHAAGDRLLKESVAAWRGELRDGDLLARYGGEEFCVVLRGCSPDEVTAVAERLRTSTPRGITVSIGSVCARQGEGQGDLLLRADRALYRAKAAGRDRVVSAEAVDAMDVADGTQGADSTEVEVPLPARGA